MGSPPTEAPNTRGVGEICDYRQITRNMSKTVQNERIGLFSTKVACRGNRMRKLTLSMTS